MWRAFFLAIGVYCFLLGVECLAIEKAVLAPSSDGGAGGFAQRVAPVYREIDPPPWAPWSLMSGGAVVVLYTFTIPQKMKS
jgi:hypothetical protein